MKRQYYWFTFRDSSRKFIATRAYLALTEEQARAMANRDSYRLLATKVTRTPKKHRGFTP
ncbi:hypothetical protein EOM33_03210 [Candidatus Saccharibacteria bacterium]|nr:hypothetical protein [Candidatus Saccharibacteria bacterium]